eukprot:m.280326 g.280326  ORF g.280326 m.280326 type:complete len:85 (+) comp40634_c0_seq31:1775-2029(+)
MREYIQLNSSYFTAVTNQDEIIQNIVSYLDTSSLSIAAQTCSLLLRHCYDASLYTELNLQPYWNTVLYPIYSCARNLRKPICAG